MSETSALEQPQHPQDGEKRCDFLYLATAAMGAVGTAIAVWPLIDSMKPSADDDPTTPVSQPMGPSVSWPPRSATI